MNKVLVIAPHPDDETLGCGGTLFRHKAEGDEIYWVIVTSISVDTGWSDKAVKKRDAEIKASAKKYGFADVINFRFPTTKIDTYPLSDLVEKIDSIIRKVSPEIIYMPFIHDVHTDHQIIASAVQSNIKWFRHPSIQKVLMYETLSETEFNYIGDTVFRPNVFVNISEFLNDKIDTMKIYTSELKEHPFPRSEKSIKALATLRGSQAGYEYAETFQLVFERQLL